MIVAETGREVKFLTDPQHESSIAGGVNSYGQIVGIALYKHLFTVIS